MSETGTRVSKDGMNPQHDTHPHFCKPTQWLFSDFGSPLTGRVYDTLAVISRSGCKICVSCVSVGMFWAVYTLVEYVVPLGCPQDTWGPLRTTS